MEQNGNLDIHSQLYLNLKFNIFEIVLIFLHILKTFATFKK